MVMLNPFRRTLSEDDLAVDLAIDGLTRRALAAEEALTMLVTAVNALPIAVVNRRATEPAPHMHDPAMAHAMRHATHVLRDATERPTR